YNEKSNALAPTMTEQSATGVATQINETFAATLGEAGLNIVSTLSEYLNDADTQALLSRMEARVGGVATQLRSGADTAEMFTALLASSKPLISGASDTITASGDAIGEASDAIDGGAHGPPTCGAPQDSTPGCVAAPRAEGPVGPGRVEDRRRPRAAAGAARQPGDRRSTGAGRQRGGPDHAPGDPRPHRRGGRRRPGRPGRVHHQPEAQAGPARGHP